MSIRINKIKRMLNIGINTIQQYLINRGIDIPNLGPGTKLDNDTCHEFLSYFSKDRMLNENASELFDKIKKGNLKLSKITTNNKTANKDFKIKDIAKINNHSTTDKNIVSLNVTDVKLNQLIYSVGHIYFEIKGTQYELENKVLFPIDNKYVSNDPTFEIKTRLNLDHRNKTFIFDDYTIYQKILKISFEQKTKYYKEIIHKKSISNTKMRIKLSKLKYDNLSASLYMYNMNFIYKFPYYIPKEVVRYINRIKYTSVAFRLEKETIMYINKRTFSFSGSFDLENYIINQYAKTQKGKYLSIIDRNQHQILSSSPSKNEEYRTELKIENIEFHDGFYLVSILKDCQKDTSIKSLSIKDRNSYKSLSYLTKYFQKRMPNNVSIIYTKYNVLGLDHPMMLNNYIKILYENMNVHGEWWGDVQNSNKRTLSHCVTYSTPYKIKKELDLKNAYIDYLSGHQSDKIVIKIYEVIGEHEEDCFIFTQDVDKDHHAIIFENVNIARSSEIFLCEKDSYNDCINYIFNYFTNYGLDTKRMNIRTKAYAAQKFKAVKYKSVNHESLQTWSATIQEFVGEINFSDRIEFIPGLRISENPDSRKLTKTELEIKFLHNNIMEKMYNILIKRYNKENIGTEIHIGKKRIDMVVKHKNFYDLYEIKTASDVRTCIRQGFGQIVDYAFFDSQDEIRNMYIVGTSIADQKERDYLYRLRKQHKLKIYYLCPDEM